MDNNINIPQSEDAEKAVDGGILVNPNALFEIVPFLKPDDFYYLRTRYVYEAFLALMDRKEPVDYLTVIAELKARNRLADIGGPAYVTELINQCPTSMHTTIYAQLVQRASIRRQLMVASDHAIHLAADESIELSEVINRVEAGQIAVTERWTGANTNPMSEAIGIYWTRLEELYNDPGAFACVRTGFHDLDHILKIESNSFTLLGGRPGMGKTAKMLSIALQMAKDNARIAYFSMEMKTPQIMNRFVAMETGVNGQRLRTGELSPHEWATFVDTAAHMHNLKIYIDDTTVWTMQKLRAKCSSMKRRLGIDLFFIDYVGLINAAGLYRNNKAAEAGYISRSLKGMALDLDTPVWGAIQIGRQVENREDKRPTLSDLRDSGDYEQDADNVLFLYRDEVYNPGIGFPGEAEIIIAKQRNGRIGTVYEYFDAEHTRFQDARVNKVDLDIYNQKLADAD